MGMSRKGAATALALTVALGTGLAVAPAAVAEEGASAAAAAVNAAGPDVRDDGGTGAPAADPVPASQDPVPGQAGPDPTNPSDPAPGTALVSATVTLPDAVPAAGSLSVRLSRDGAVVQTVAVGEGGAVAFAPEAFDAPGTYTLSLSMAPSADPAVAVDARTVAVAVTVTASDDGASLSAEVSYDGSAQAPTFTCTYVPRWEGDGASRRYRLSDGTYAASRWLDVDGRRYAFDAAGHVRTGWYDEGGRRYYLAPADGASGPRGAMALGWVTVDGHRYLMDRATGALRTGWADDGGQRYYLRVADTQWGPRGTAAQGWLTEGGQRFYLRWTGSEDGPAGSLVTGWFDDGGQRFWSRREDTAWGPRGSLGSGWLMEDGQTYYLRRSDTAYGPRGSLGSGWLNEGGQPSVLRRAAHPWGPRGSLGSGWLDEGGQRYFLRRADNPWGPMGTIGSGWLDEGGRRYFLRRAGSPWGPRGSLGKGWLTDGGSRFLLDRATGAARTGWVRDGGTWYWFRSNGVLDPAHPGKEGWQNPSGYYQVSCRTVSLGLSASVARNYYVTPSRISPYASKADCVNAFVQRANEYIGTPYVWNYSHRPGVGVDCIGLVYQCAYATGMSMGEYNPYNHWVTGPNGWHSHDANNVWDNGKIQRLPVSLRQRGDLVFWPGHVAIYVGGDRIVEAWPGAGVRTASLWAHGTPRGIGRLYI